MASVKKSVLVPFSAHRMYSLVDDVQSYPQFLPWCGEATLLEQTEGRTVARLMIDYRGIRHAFTTENQHLPGEAIRISLAGDHAGAGDEATSAVALLHQNVFAGLHHALHHPLHAP